MNQSTGNSRNEEVILDKELYGVFEGLLLGNEHLVEFLGLSNVARESIQNESTQTSSIVKSC